MEQKDKHSINWSLDERHLRVEDTEEEFYLIDISFDSDLDQLDKKGKLELLQRLINELLIPQTS